MALLVLMCRTPQQIKLIVTLDSTAVTYNDHIIEGGPPARHATKYGEAAPVKLYMTIFSRHICIRII